VASQQQKKFQRALLCVVLSVLLHVLLGILLLCIPPVEQVKRPAAAARKSRAVQVIRTADRKMADALTKKQQEETPSNSTPL
jgi:hypothetical protein